MSPPNFPVQVTAEPRGGARVSTESDAHAIDMILTHQAPGTGADPGTRFWTGHGPVGRLAPPQEGARSWLFCMSWREEEAPPGWDAAGPAEDPPGLTFEEEEQPR